MKVLSAFNLFFISIVAFLMCDSSLNTVLKENNKRKTEKSLLLVQDQILLPHSIKGVEFYRKNYIGSPPIIRLNSTDQLILRFDELSSLSGQFRVTFTHYNQDWKRSNLAEIWVYEGINDLAILGGNLNAQSNPNYYSYQYIFPNRDINFLVSGNYMITISDFDSGIELFNLPFFVTENIGDLHPNVTTFFNSGPLSSAMDQISGTYIYPDFIEFPQFNLTFRISQNRFWGINITPNQNNFIDEGESSFQLTESQFLPAYVEFNTLDLRRLSLQNSQIFGYERTEIPEKIILRNDYLNFTSDIRTITETGYGRPTQDITSRILNVEFSYETQGKLPKNSDIYLIGDFNQWTISNNYKLKFNSEYDIYKINMLIKQGLYNYQYAVIKNGAIDTYLNVESLSQKSQEYAAFVYYKDPDLLYDRLLNSRIFYSE